MSVPDGYTLAPDWVNVRPLICSKCGASVAQDTMSFTTHNLFHQGYDEIVEWAQSISELFSQANESKHEWEPGDPIE